MQDDHDDDKGGRRTRAGGRARGGGGRRPEGDGRARERSATPRDGRPDARPAEGPGGRRAGGGRGAPRGGARGGARGGTQGGARAGAELPLFEVEVLEGLEPLARAELASARVTVEAEHPGGLRVRTADALALRRLRLAAAVYRVLRFDVPRPKALLGDEHFRRLVEALRPGGPASPDRMQRFRFAAAGSDSPVFRRLATALEGATGLGHDAEEGELLLRVRRDPHGPGWEVLARLTPRPLSARPWRACNRAGGLNATVAVAMNDVAEVRPADRYLNLMCGSGTLLVERALAGEAARLVGVDADPEAIACARQNLGAARVAERVELRVGDLRDLPATERFDVLTVDLPWGDAVGDHATNERLYPAVLEVAARLAAPDARLVVLTHELRLFERALEGQGAWRVEHDLHVAHGGHHPRLARLGPAAAAAARRPR